MTRQLQESSKGAARLPARLPDHPKPTHAQKIACQNLTNAKLSNPRRPQLASGPSEHMADILVGSQRQHCGPSVWEADRLVLDAELRPSGPQVALVHTDQPGEVMARETQDSLTVRALQRQASLFLLRAAMTNLGNPGKSARCRAVAAALEHQASLVSA